MMLFYLTSETTQDENNSTMISIFLTTEAKVCKKKVINLIEKDQIINKGFFQVQLFNE